MTALDSLPKSVKAKFVHKKIITIKKLAENDFEKLRECKFLSTNNTEKVIDEIKEFFPDKI